MASPFSLELGILKSHENVIKTLGKKGRRCARDAGKSSGDNNILVSHETKKKLVLALIFCI
jgi:hypothetical protein